MSAHPLIVQYYPILRAITRIKDKEMQRKMLKFLCKEKKFKHCICELAHNTVKQNLPLSKKDKTRLNKQASLVKSILKKKKIDQSGGFLNVVVPLLATVVGELIASRVRK